MYEGENQPAGRWEQMAAPRFDEDEDSEPGCPRAFEQSTHPSWHPDVSAIGRGVTDWYQRLGYRELGY
ncbi:hypothetical protein E3N88_06769 [Mikania micrantha]|uniref:Uncharacterized protein n=1 Tax=Mikania micrantha TaxID=192012 RepID=A0A5N6PPM9_9ASTR|nr:hypothetical protein E3N88_06769 [Mikania micrantha]